jgi:EmrB/QacA subfamily drug resistance transporter
MLNFLLSLIGIGLGQYAEVVDNTMLNIALPTISNDMNISLSMVQWIPITFVLVTSSLLLPSAKISDIYGRKKIYLIGLIIFCGAVFITGKSELILILILFKSIQGVGSAAIQSNGMAMIIQLFDIKDRGKALGIFMSIIGIGSITSPIIGGYIIDTYGWRGIFNFVTLVTIVAIIFGSFINIEKNILKNKFDFDLRGTVFSTLTISSLIISISMFTSSGWNYYWILIGLPLSVIFLFLFIFYEKNSKSMNPLISLDLFKNNTFKIGNLARFTSFISNSPIYYLSPFLLINGYGLSSSKTGVFILPGPIMMAFSGPIAGRLSDKFGSYYPRVLGAASLLVSVSIYLFAGTLNKEFVMFAYAFQGLGMGVFGSANTSYIFSSIKQNEYGSVNALLTLIRTSGNIIGISLSTAFVLLYLPEFSDDKLNQNFDSNGYISAISKSFVLPVILSFITLLLTLNSKNQN